MILDFEFSFKMKQGILWEINGWVLRGYWLITYIRSMLDCHVIKTKKGKEIEKGIEELTKIGEFKSWKTLNDKSCQTLDHLILGSQVW